MVNITERELRALCLSGKVSQPKTTKKRRKAAPAEAGEGEGTEGRPLYAKGRLPRGLAEDAAVPTPWLVEFRIPVQPRPKERPRVAPDMQALLRAFRAAAGDAHRFMSIISRQDGGGGFMRSFTPKGTRAFEDVIALAAQAHMRRIGMEPADFPVELEFEFGFEGESDVWPTAIQDGDLDNIEKAAQDAMNRILYTDDRLVVRKTGIKCCSVAPYVAVRMRRAR